MQQAALDELREPLVEIGRRWARSSHRPRPSAESLLLWDRLLSDWIASDLPLILRDSRRRGQRFRCIDGREVVMADNSPANWTFAQALDGVAPDLSEFTSANIDAKVPLTFVSKGEAAKRCLNTKGWKVCHIEPVSDRKRRKIETVPTGEVQAAFRRFLSPRNIFLVPKIISGAGELPEVVEAIPAFEHEQAMGRRELASL